mgnify:CR=1 FL=1
MKNRGFVIAGVASSGVGLVVGIAMSSTIPSTPFVFGTTIAVYAAVAAAVVGGSGKRGVDLRRE